MIKFENGELLDISPPGMARDVEFQCISHALKRQIDRVIKHANQTRTQSMIDQLPEPILDILAAELRTPYYQESMELSVKREIIKRTLLWHTKAGTPSAVEELIEVVFGDGKVVEWFDYDEGPFTPGTFDIITNARMTEDVVEYFMQVVRRVKNTRSHIRRILITREMEMHEYVGSGTVTSPEIPVTNNYTGNLAPEMAEAVGAGTITSPEETITNSPQGRTASLISKEGAAAGAASAPHETIGNYAEPKQAKADGNSYAASIAASSTEIRIYNGALKTAVAIAALPKSAAAGTSVNSTIQIT